MTSASRDDSSFGLTAHYTGYTWVANGLSFPPFQTTRGRLLYQTLNPVERLGRLLFGQTLRTYLLQRHLLIDHRLETAFDDRCLTQVLEIGAGLSPRGCRMLRDHPELTYVEADLPAMAARKRRLLAGIDGPTPRVADLDIFADDSRLSLRRVLETFDTDRPIAVVTEGLVNYFDRDTATDFWKRLRRNFSDFPLGVYLTDDYVLDRTHGLHAVIRMFVRLMSLIFRSDVSIHFGDDDRARSYFQTMGYDAVRVHNPRNYYDRLAIPKSRGEPVVRVIEARTGR